MNKQKEKGLLEWSIPAFFTVFTSVLASASRTFQVKESSLSKRMSPCSRKVHLTRHPERISTFLSLCQTNIRIQPSDALLR